MITTYKDTYENFTPAPEEGLDLTFSATGATGISGRLADQPSEETMTLQDQLRGEQAEVADTGALLTQAADRIDELETLLAGSGDPARIAELEGALTQIQAIIAGVSV